MTYKFKEITVLIVDSQPAIIDLIQGVLRMFGVQKIITRTDGKSGLAAFKSTAPDIVIIDWDLASVNGLTFTKTIRSGTINPYVPIIFMTSFSSLKRVSAARDCGITEFLRKPFTAESLYKRIETIVEKPRAFVRAPQFFGPDRRRRNNGAYKGPEKRGDDLIFVDKKP